MDVAKKKTVILKMLIFRFVPINRKTTKHKRLLNITKNGYPRFLRGGEMDDGENIFAFIMENILVFPADRSIRFLKF